jgi:hypothetical protein
VNSCLARAGSHKARNQSCTWGCNSAPAHEPKSPFIVHLCLRSRHLVMPCAAPPPFLLPTPFLGRRLTAVASGQSNRSAQGGYTSPSQPLVHASSIMCVFLGGVQVDILSILSASCAQCC